MVNNLKILRVMKYRNQSDAADKTGISRPLFSMIESGRYYPTEDTIQKLESTFTKSVGYLLAEFTGTIDL